MNDNTRPGRSAQPGAGDAAPGMRWLVWALLPGLCLLMPALVQADADLDEQVRAIAAQLRCPVCQNLSVADSPSELAQEMRGVIREQLQAGKTPDEIKAYFLEKYGDWILLSPRPRGLSLLLWWGPFAAAAAGLVVAAVAIRRWARRPLRSAAPPPDPVLLDRVRREALDEDLAAPDNGTPGSPLVAERARLYAALRELDFDHRAGKLSAGDYAAMRQEYEGRASAVLAALERASREAAGRPAALTPSLPASKPPRSREMAARPRSWRLAGAGVLLLIFGVAIGVSLTMSLRPRTSEQDTITGDFLTGTGPLGISPGSRSEPGAVPLERVQAALAAGTAAFERQDWGAAIRSFRQALELDPDNPTAHAHLGLILLRAGHVEPALAALDRALARNPNDHLALWAKGWTLYEGKQDYVGAIAVWERLLAMNLAAADADRIGAVIAEARQKQTASAAGAPARPASRRSEISGTVTVAPSLSGKLPEGATLFLIARKGPGPPLAVRRISSPSFPLAFSLGPEDVMLRGAPFEGEVTLAARLKRDGTAGPPAPGDLGGEAPAPVRVGQRGVQIVLDKAD